MANWIEGVTFQDNLQLNPTINWDFFVNVQEIDEKAIKSDNPLSLDICAEALRLTFNSSSCLESSAFEQYLEKEETHNNVSDGDDESAVDVGKDDIEKQNVDYLQVEELKAVSINSKSYNRQIEDTLQSIDTSGHQIVSCGKASTDTTYQNPEVERNSNLTENYDKNSNDSITKGSKNESVSESISLDQSNSIDGSKSDSSGKVSINKDSSLSSNDSNDSTTWTPTPCTNDPSKNPQIPYIELCAGALLSSKQQRMLLTDIYSWVMEKFPYFQTALCAWRNSIRHALCVNECFIKAARAPVGRGFYWAIHPACLEDFKRGDFNRRQARKRVQEALRSMDNPPAKRQRTNVMSSNQPRKDANSSKATTSPVHALSYTPRSDNLSSGNSPTNAYLSNDETQTHCFAANRLASISPTNTYSKKSVMNNAYTQQNVANNNNTSPTHGYTGYTDVNTTSPLQAYRAHHQAPLSASTPLRDPSISPYHPAYNHTASSYMVNYNSTKYEAIPQSYKYHSSPVYTNQQSFGLCQPITATKNSYSQYPISPGYNNKQSCGVDQPITAPDSHYPTSPVYCNKQSPSLSQPTTALEFQYPTSPVYGYNNMSSSYHNHSMENAWNSQSMKKDFHLLHKETLDTPTQSKQSDSGYATCLTSPYTNSWASHTPYSTAYHTPQTVPYQYKATVDNSENNCTYA